MTVLIIERVWNIKIECKISVRYLETNSKSTVQDVICQSVSCKIFSHFNEEMDFTKLFIISSNIGIDYFNIYSSTSSSIQQRCTDFIMVDMLFLPMVGQKYLCQHSTFSIYGQQLWFPFPLPPMTPVWIILSDVEVKNCQGQSVGWE